MQRSSGWLWKGLVAVPVCVGYQVLVHSALLDGLGRTIRLTLAAIPLLLIGYLVAKRARRKWLWAIALLAAGAAIYIMEVRDHLGLTVANVLTHTCINLVMLWLFGRTLVRGREPLITGFARRLHGTLPPAMEAYTRHVTLAWSVFFFLQIAISGALLGFSSLDKWSFFVNVLSLPLVASMFVLEYIYRVMRYRSFQHASMLESVEMFARSGASSTPSGGVINASIARDMHG
jgi:uncharacterized membrane protein